MSFPAWTLRLRIENSFVVELAGPPEMRALTGSFLLSPQHSLVSRRLLGNSAGEVAFPEHLASSGHPLRKCNSATIGRIRLSLKLSSAIHFLPFILRNSSPCSPPRSFFPALRLPVHRYSRHELLATPAAANRSIIDLSASIMSKSFIAFGRNQPIACPSRNVSGRPSYPSKNTCTFASAIC
jgi:hypothetical protein